MKVAVVFTLDVPDGTDPQRVLDVVNRELDSAADGGGLVQYGDWGYTPALLAWATGPGGRMPDACEYCGASGNGGHGGGCPNGSGSISRGDLEALLAIAAWTAREHGDTLPEALLIPAGDVLARYDVHLDTT